MLRRALSAPLIRALVAILAVLTALVPAVALAAPKPDPGLGQPFGIDWTPIVYWAVIGGVILGGFLLGILVDWGNR